MGSQKYHDDPLTGGDKMIWVLQRNYYWRGMKKDVQKYLQKCTVCQRWKAPVVKPPLTPILAQRVLERVLIDVELDN